MMRYQLTSPRSHRRELQVDLSREKIRESKYRPNPLFNCGLPRYTHNKLPHDLRGTLKYPRYLNTESSIMARLAT